MEDSITLAVPFYIINAPFLISDKTKSADSNISI